MYDIPANCESRSLAPPREWEYSVRVRVEPPEPYPDDDQALEAWVRINGYESDLVFYSPVKILDAPDGDEFLSELFDAFGAEHPEIQMVIAPEDLVVLRWSEVR